MDPTTPEQDGTDRPSHPITVRLATFAAGAAAFVGARAWVEEADLVSTWIWKFVISCLAFAIASTAVRLLITRLVGRRGSRPAAERVPSDSVPERGPGQPGGGAGAARS